MERHGPAKLTAALVREIRHLYATDHYSYSKLAKLFGVTIGAIGGIVTGKAWRHVEAR